MHTMSPVQVERVFAAHSSLVETKQQSEDLKGRWAEAKKRKTEAQAELLACVQGAREKCQKSKATMARDEQDALWKREKEFTRAINAFELLDREKRRCDDLVKKLEARVLAIIADARAGEDLYAGQSLAKAGGEEWGAVLIADLVGDLAARPLVGAAACHTVAEFVGQWKNGELEKLVKARELDSKTLEYVGAKVRDYLVGRDLKSKVPKGMADLPAASLKHVDVPAPEEKPKGEAEADDETGQTYMGLKKAHESKAADDIPIGGGVSTSHLDVSVHELDVPPRVQGLLIATGHDTIRRTVDTVETKGEICKHFGLSTTDAKLLLQALDKYRKAHRKADAEAQREAKPEPRQRLGKRAARGR